MSLAILYILKGATVIKSQYRKSSNNIRTQWMQGLCLPAHTLCSWQRQGHKSCDKPTRKTFKEVQAGITEWLTAVSRVLRQKILSSSSATFRSGPRP